MISKHNLQPKQYDRGFSLVETLVALSVLLIALVAPLTVASKSLQNIYFAQENLVAVMLAQEGVEAVVQLHRDSQLDTIKNGGTSWDWFTSLDSDCVGAGGAGCAMDFNDSTSNPVNVSSQSCSVGNTCAIYLDTSDDRAKYSHQSAGGTLTPFNRAIRVWDIGNGVYPQVMVESEVTWSTSVFVSDQSVIARTTLFDVATTSI